MVTLSQALSYCRDTETLTEKSEKIAVKCPPMGLHALPFLWRSLLKWTIFAYYDLKTKFFIPKPNERYPKNLKKSCCSSLDQTYLTAKFQLDRQSARFYTGVSYINPTPV